MQKPTKQNKEMNKWPVGFGVTVPFLLTIGAMTVLHEWNHAIIYFGLGVSWFFSGGIHANYSVYRQLTEKNNERTIGNR